LTWDPDELWGRLRRAYGGHPAHLPLARRGGPAPRSTGGDRLAHRGILLGGINADLTVLKSPTVLGLTAALIVVASLGKFLGAFVGGAIGGLSRAESLAIAIGMNARGSTEVIVASIGLSVGALSSSLYSMIATMAVLATCAMPPS
jgi:hypothetical protein